MHCPLITKQRLCRLGYAEYSDLGIVYSSLKYHESKMQRKIRMRKTVNIAVVGKKGVGKSRVIETLTINGNIDSPDGMNLELNGFSLTGICEFESVYLIFSEIDESSITNHPTLTSSSSASSSSSSSSSSLNTGLESASTPTHHLSSSCCTAFDIVLLLFNSGDESSFDYVQRIEVS